MRAVATYLRRLRDRIAKGDEGMSLTELLVGMGVMVVFLTIFTGAVYSMTTTMNKVEAVTTSSGQTNTAFLKLDKLVRYASAITTPATASSGTGDWYVELSNFNSDTSVETCTQLRVDITSQQLQMRTWTATGATSYTGLSGWSPLANSITNGAAASGSADQPFTTPAALASASTSFQRLTINLVAAGDGSSASTTVRSTQTFTALNSVAGATTNSTKCQQLASGGRP